MAPWLLGAAVEDLEEGGEVAVGEKPADRDEDDEHLDTLLARLRGGWTGESRRSLGRPERS